MGAEDLEGVFHLDAASGVVDLIRRIHEDRARQPDRCVNFEKYRI